MLESLDERRWTLLRLLYLDLATSFCAVPCQSLQSSVGAGVSEEKECVPLK
jgi:hypothetical protein